MRKNKGEKKKLKLIKYLIIILIVIAIISGIVFYFKNKNKKEVPVYSMRDIGTDFMWDSGSPTSDGMIKEDRMQAVYVSSTQKPEKVLVKEGQNVKKGDPLLKYNTTLSNLELERKQLDIKKLELDLSKAQKDLATIKTYQPDVPIYGSLPTPPPEVEESQDPIPEQPKSPVPEVPKEEETNPAPLTGAGTDESPYLYLWDQNKEYDKTFIETLLKRAGKDKTEVIAIFMNRENGSTTGNLLSYSKIKFMKKDNEYTFKILESKNGNEEDPLYPNNKEDNNENQNNEPENVPEVGPIYTATELQKMIFEKEKEISDITLNIKIAKSEYKKSKEELEDTTVYSKLDGVVKTVLSIDDENLSTKPIIVVSSGGGYYVEGKIGELNLKDIKIGQKINVQSFESGTFAEGTVEKISNYPLSNNYWNGMGNSNVSYYAYTVKIDDTANFKEGEYASLTLVSDTNEGTNTNTIYLSNPFVISENGENFVYCRDENSKLTKREIKVGKNMNGLLEIRGGITMDDRIAFPYGKEVKEGAKTREASADELYSRNVEMG